MSSNISTLRRRRKVLITGGSGTVGRAFIGQFYNEFRFHNIGRNEVSNNALQRDFPFVKSHTADIQDRAALDRLFQEIQPDVVIHSAALKHVNQAEVNPSRTVEINILGSLNVARAASQAEVPIVIGISTDKACQPENIYGYSKKILEQIFMEHYSQTSRFVCTRFANIACSSGSVIPFWIENAKAGNPLQLTDSRMNRLMFSRKDAAGLIRDAITLAEESNKAFVMCSRMKSVGLLDLANLISQDFGQGQKPEIVGLRPGERLNEVLVSQQELPHAFYTENEKYITLYSDEFGQRRVTEQLSSLTADYMSSLEMRALYSEYTEPSQDRLHIAANDR